jgi:hypothetical protein
LLASASEVTNLTVHRPSSNSSAFCPDTAAEEQQSGFQFLSHTELQKNYRVRVTSGTLLSAFDPKMETLLLAFALNWPIALD